MFRVCIKQYLWSKRLISKDLLSVHMQKKPLLCILFFTKIMTLTCEQSKFNALLLFFGRSVMSDSLRPHGLQHARLSCPLPSLDFAPTHVHRVSDAIQPSHLLSTHFPLALNLSQHQSLSQV